MATRTLTGTYSAGYTLSSTYSALIVTPSARITGAAGTVGGHGGAGLIINTAASVANAGSITGGVGGYGDPIYGSGAGGAGVRLAGGASLANTGTITGGAGGAGSRYGNYDGYGGYGGDGIRAASGASVVTGGKVIGGVGGVGGLAAPGGFAFGGRGGLGVALTGAASLANTGTIIGGAGGSSLADSAGTGGYGADGVGAAAGASVVNRGEIIGGAGGAGSVYGGPGRAGVGLIGAASLANNGTITGGAGGAGVFSEGYSTDGGYGGAGVSLSGYAAGSSVVNRGEIVGGVGGTGDYAGAGGAGVFSYVGSVSILNTGAILGGQGLVTGGGVILDITQFGQTSVVINGAAGVSSALISGAVGVYASNTTTVTNFGTIEGTSGVSVEFGYNGVSELIAEAGSTFIGAIEGGGGRLALAGGVGSISGLGGDGTLTGAVDARFRGFASYAIDAGGSWTLEGTNTLGVARGLLVDGALTSTGTFTVMGTITGAGTLTVAGGTTSLDESVAFRGTFGEQAGATVAVAAGDKLTLTGTTRLYGTLAGAGIMAVTDASVGGLTIGGTAALTVGGAVTQTGVVAIGDASASAASLSIFKTGVWDIGSGDILRGMATTNRLFDYGLLIKNAGADVSTVGVITFDDGAVEAASGRLDFTQALFGTGTLKIEAGASLEADSSVWKTLTTTFDGADATLALATPGRFAATIIDFAATDVIDLVRIKATGARVNASDQLVIVDGTTTVATLRLGEGLTGATFSTASDGKGGTDIMLVDAVSVTASPHLMASAMAAMAPAAGVMLPVHDARAIVAPLLSRPGAQPA